jgi:AcrR family transcriptional regulator
MSRSAANRSTAQARRQEVLRAATEVFARSGYYATTIADVAEATGISQAYVMRLFGSKLGLFVSVVDQCNERVTSALAAAAAQVPAGTPEAVLDAMYGAYADLIHEPSLIMIQVHAQSVADIPEIRDAVWRGLGKLVESVKVRSRANDAQVQRIVAFGTLCQLIVAVDLEDVRLPWAQTLTGGIRHPDRLLEQGIDDGSRLS